MVSDAQVEQVRAVVAGIPAGRVRTYGDIAAECDLSTPRIVAWVLRTDGADLPWHRVVPASGRPAAPVRQRQETLLRDEGVAMTDGRIDMRVARMPTER